MCVRSLGWEDPLEEGMATHSSILAWTIPWTEDLAGYSPQGLKELNTTIEATYHVNTHQGWARGIEEQENQQENLSPRM